MTKLFGFGLTSFFPHFITFCFFSNLYTFIRSAVVPQMIDYKKKSNNYSIMKYCSASSNVQKCVHYLIVLQVTARLVYSSRVELPKLDTVVLKSNCSTTESALCEKSRTFSNQSQQQQF